MIAPSAMSRIAYSLWIASLLAGCSEAGTKASIPPETQAAMSRLRLGMTEDAALAVMRPVALDTGRITFGGTGSGLLYFQISPTRQFHVEMGPGPDFKITRIGHVEAKRKWIRDSRGNLSFE